MPASEAVVLPETARPSKYRIKLHPDLKNFTFSGEQSVDLQVLEATTSIVLNVIDLKISVATLHANGVTLSNPKITIDKEAETATLDFGETIQPGDGRLEMIFSGELNDKLMGFYRSEYTAQDGETRYMATTQFEPTDARRAFPCWDEPAKKATFEVTLVFSDEYEAISNTPAVDEAIPGPGLKSVRFAETPVMSTYLLAFIVGNLVSIQERAEGGTKVGVWTTPGKENQATFALDTSVKLLGYFNDYFGIPYPLAKLDHIAIPDFAAGAMENWGAVTYRETALLVDPDNSSAGTRQRVAEVIAHEMAHMWFGDLVTMEWWDDLWLNESFASWMGNKAVDWLFPEWEMWTQFVNMDTNRALSLDGLKNSHPIEQAVMNPAEVSQLFDAISYSKGASVIRMLENFLGEETFRKGLNRYLSGHMYDNARTQDLWSALETESGQPVTAIMDSWVKQMGYPVLQVESDRSGAKTQLSVSQERFVYDSLLGDSEPDAEVWRVPISASQGGEESPITVMEGNQTQIEVPGNSDSWVKLNPLQTGFFRVNYSAEDWQRLVPAIESLELHATDRLGIQNDAYALSRAGILPVTQFISMANAYKNENDASVWSDLASNLRDIEQLISEEPIHGAYQKFARELFAPAAAKIGWEPKADEGHLDALLRSTVLSQAGSYNNAEVTAQATERFQKYLADRETLTPDLRGVVFALAAQSGGKDVYDSIWQLEGETDLAEEKIRLLMSLSRFQQADLLTAALEDSLSSKVRSQDTVTLVASIAANPKGRDLAWDFVKSNWTEFDRRYGGGGFGLMRLVSICSHFSSQEKSDEVDSFFAEHPAPAAERTIRQVLERVKLNIKWLEINRPLLTDWFASNK
ncbi:MAG: M1 family metallopeptidase [Dehalococcoidia bacterium]|jgi:puromycin-sensitive aminopeptidase|nr:M1 family metallopeptidase [Dehalococcoidia bacterium]